MNASRTLRCLATFALLHCSPQSPVGTTDGSSVADSAADSAVNPPIDGQANLSDVPSVSVDADTDGASDAGTDASADAGSAMPINAPNEQWTFVPIDGMQCGNGSPTGIGINRSPRSSKVLFILQGGGACWDVATCFVIRAAANLDGYTAANFASERGALENAAILDRADANNPFRDATFVYIPYCTGDVHSGRRVFRYEALGMTREVHHVGAQNMDALIARVHATIPAPEHVWLYGLSAGGYGVVMNWWRFIRNFAGSPVEALSDCGVPITPPDGRYATWVQTWNSELPPNCMNCDRDLQSVLTTQLGMFRTQRYAQLAFTDDRVLTAFYGLGPGGFAPLVQGFHTRMMSEPNARTYVVTSPEHVMVGAYRTTRTMDGTLLSDWVPQWATGAANWTSHSPY